MQMLQTERQWNGPSGQNRKRAAKRNRDSLWQESEAALERLSRAIGLMGGGALSLYAARLYGRRRSDRTALAAALAALGLVMQAVMPRDRRTGLFAALRREGALLGQAAIPAASPPLTVRASTTIARPAEDLYAFWRQLSNLPQIMTNLESVEVDEDGTSRWTAEGPGRMHVVWRAKVIDDKPSELIAWRSLDGGEIQTAGSVSFRPTSGGHGTEVCLQVSYDQPGGKLGAWFARSFGQAPEQEVQDELRRFKQLMETGEIATTLGQSSGVR